MQKQDAKRQTRVQRLVQAEKINKFKNVKSLIEAFKVNEEIYREDLEGSLKQGVTKVLSEYLNPLLAE
jgi:hypothetical protein